MGGGMAAVWFLAVLFTSPVGSQQLWECKASSSRENCYRNAALADLASLCGPKAMPNMIGCALQLACGSSTEDYCHPLSLLADICQSDPGMVGMLGCSPYNRTCMVAQNPPSECASHGPLPGVIGTDKTTQDLIQMCREMVMAPCSQCTSPTHCPNPLLTMSTICKDHTMTECADWVDMCSNPGVSEELPGKAFCPSGGAALPLMQMYFHFGLKDFVLFKSWVPQNAWQYTWAVVFTILMGIFVIFLKALRSYWEKIIREKHLCQTPPAENLPSECCCPHPRPAGKESDLLLNGDRTANGNGPQSSGSTSWIPTWSDWKCNAVRAAFVLVTTVLDYCLMLIVMTCNVGLFMAVCVGLALGTLIFGHKLTFNANNSCCEA
eukprot:NODE_461_length_1460_cov_269.064493_g342_i0.p1 GENE.NODE_461_length_1460_cov_269.064493_g342_i0~~NODE_461_length_1460_cov_269.064493_g342_i0.p1  ORF type:complete len:379 (+),score=55.82 NODE_461_length_1460_cov_269.064493_g342_i0:53-1189(+)